MWPLATQPPPQSSPPWVLLLFGLIAALGGLGGLASLVYARQTGQKLNSEAHKYGVDADVALSGQALEWLKDTRAEMVICRRRYDALHDHLVNVLEPMMREQGMNPPPFRDPE